MKEFESLKKINDNYKTTIDALSVEFETDAARDARYSDEITARRLQEHNARFNAAIDAEAKKAVEEAAPEFAKLREKLRTYITTSGDPVTIAALQSLIEGGVELSDAEIAAFADGAGYAVLRLLEGPSKGHVQAPKLDKLEAELKELEAHFRSLRAYRGGMAGASTEIFWGTSARVGNLIQGAWSTDSTRRRTKSRAAGLVYLGRTRSKKEPGAVNRPRPLRHIPNKSTCVPVR